jgi:hypothetical protein
MLIHIVPRFYSLDGHPRLIDVSIPDLGLKLSGQADLAVANPYAGSGWYVACRKGRHGGAVVEGFHVDLHNPPEVFTVVQRWATAKAGTVIHTVRHVLLDRTAGLASGAMLLWFAHRAWSLRWPDQYPRSWSIQQAQPRMDHAPGRAEGLFTDETRNGLIVQRDETLWLPGLEPDRLAAPGYLAYAALPEPAHAFVIRAHGNGVRALRKEPILPRSPAAQHPVDRRQSH